MKQTLGRTWRFAFEREDGDDWPDVKRRYTYTQTFCPSSLVVVIRQQPLHAPEFSDVKAYGLRRLKNGSTSDIPQSQGWASYELTAPDCPQFVRAAAYRALALAVAEYETLTIQAGSTAGAAEVAEDDPVVLLSYDEAVALLPEGDRIHTFLDSGVILVGADWDRADVLALLERTDRREVTGPAAQKMKHGLAAYRDGIPVFIETKGG
jgi:hypothetical protein